MNENMKRFLWIFAAMLFAMPPEALAQGVEMVIPVP